MQSAAQQKSSKRAWTIYRLRGMAASIPVELSFEAKANIITSINSALEELGADTIEQHHAKQMLQWETSLVKAGDIVRVKTPAGFQHYKIGDT